MEVERHGGQMGESVGREIKRLREARGWGQAKLAVAAGMSVSGVSQIENGKRNLSTATLHKLAKALGVEVADLFPKAEAPLPFKEPEGDASAARRTLIASWAHYAESLRDRMQKLLDGLPALPDNKEALADNTARILELQNDFWAMQRTLVESGASEIMTPHFRAITSGEHVPDDAYQDMRTFRSAQRSMMLDLNWRGDKWIHDAEQTFGAFVKPDRRPAVSQEVAAWANRVAKQ